MMVLEESMLVIRCRSKVLENILGRQGLLRMVMVQQHLIQLRMILLDQLVFL